MNEDNAYIASTQRYEQISYQRVGKSGLKLPLLSLGLWHNFGHVDSFEKGRDMILHAFDLGITHFDLANNYGPPPGSAEENFGKMISKELKSYRDELIISTKAGYRMWEGPYGEWGSKKNLIASLDQSLKRMKLEYVDIFYHHRPDPDTPPEESMGALHQIVQQGKALYIGISNYKPTEAEQAFRILKGMGTRCLIHQPRYSMFDRWVEGGLLDVLEKHGVGCIPFSPLAQGLLTDKYLKGIPPNSRAAGTSPFLNENQITRDKIAKVQLLNAIAQNRGQSMAQMAIAWLLKDNRISSVLIGASTKEQIVDLVNCKGNMTFSNDELTQIDSILMNDNG